MAFNGSGAFVRLYNWVSDRNAAIKIRADRMDAEMDGFATGLSNCITKDGQTTITQDIPFNNKRLTGLGDATAAADAVSRQFADARLGSFGQCYLTKSGANIILQPLNGNKLFVGGEVCTVPNGFVSLAPTGLTPNTLYYIYAVATAGVVSSLEASTTAPGAGSVAPYVGWQIKTGDASRTLVGMVYVLTGPAFADSGTQRLVASYFNRVERPLAAVLATTAAITATSFGNVSSSLSFEFLTWGDEPVRVAVNGSWAVSGAATGFARIFFDGTTAGVAKSATSNSSTNGLAMTEVASTLVRGYHIVSLQAYRSGGTNVQFFGTSTGADYECSLSAATRA